MRRRRQWRTTLRYNHDIIINRKYVSSVTLEFRFKLSKLFKYSFQSLFISYSSHTLRIMRSETFAFFKTFAIHDTSLISLESAHKAKLIKNTTVFTRETCFRLANTSSICVSFLPMGNFQTLSKSKMSERALHFLSDITLDTNNRYHINNDINIQVFECHEDASDILQCYINKHVSKTTRITNTRENSLLADTNINRNRLIYLKG